MSKVRITSNNLNLRFTVEWSYKITIIRLREMYCTEQRPLLFGQMRIYPWLFSLLNTNG